MVIAAPDTTLRPSIFVNTTGRGRRQATREGDELSVGSMRPRPIMARDGIVVGTPGRSCLTATRRGVAMCRKEKAAGAIGPRRPLPRKRNPRRQQSTSDADPDYMRRQEPLNGVLSLL
jgi:hypothetical protein